MKALRYELICRHCGQSFISRQPTAAFCSKDCMYLYMQQKRMTANPLPALSLDETKKEFDSEPESDLGQAWMRAGLKYDAMTRRALSEESRKTQRRSIIIAGYGAGLNVKHDRLIVRYGTSYAPQELISEELDRATHGVYRIVWCGASGSISYLALQWCQEQNIDLFVMDKDGGILTESNNNKSTNIFLKRRQYSMTQEKLQEIAQWIILGKIMAQCETCRSNNGLCDESTASMFTRALHDLSKSTATTFTLEEIRMREMLAAKAYFEAWRNVPLRWDSKDRATIPAHWNVIGDRNSALGKKTSAIKPISPAQAILNYAYGILAHSTRAALLAVGLDPAVGILHADMVGRHSLVFDLMELGRGMVDGIVLQFLRNTEFRKGDFTVVTDGSIIRMHPELTRAVAASCQINQDYLLEKALVLRAMIVGDLDVIEIDS